MAFRENRSFGTTYYLYINSDGNLYEKSNEPKEGFVQHINPNSGQPAGYWKEYYNGVVGYINYIGLKSSAFSNGNTVTNFLIVLKDYELNGIESFVNELLKIKNSITIVNNYYLGYSIPQIGKEFDLLLFLASNKGRVFTKKQIYSQVWEEEYAFDDSNIMSFISKLRKKIEPDPDHPFYILTVRGVGYRFNKEA